jgi:hypothetical protein
MRRAEVLTWHSATLTEAPMFRNPFGRKKPDRLVMRLRYPATPENAAQFADDMVLASKRAGAKALDYTPDSLSTVDEIMDRFRASGDRVDDNPEALFSFGCYVGEVFVRHAGAKWRRVEQTPLADVESSPLVLEMPNGNILNPVGKVFKRLELGPGESVRYFYAAFTADT